MKTLRVALALLLFLSAVALVAQENQRTAQDLDLLEKAYAARKAPDAAEWRGRVDGNMENLRTSFDWLIAHDRGEEALRFAIPFAYFLTAENQQKDAGNVLTRALEVPSARTATSIRAQALYQAGILAFREGDQARSRALNEESLRIARLLRDRAAEATALIGLSRIALRNHDYKAVRADAEKAAELRRKAGDQAGSIAAMHMVAAAARMQGDDARAQQIYESTLVTYRAAGDKARATDELFNLGYVQLHQNRVAKAEELFGEALQEFRKRGNDAAVAYCLTGFAAADAAKKDGERAAQLYGAADAILKRLHITLDPDDQLDWDRYTAIARNELGSERYETGFERGHSLTIDQAIALTRQ